MQLNTIWTPYFNYGIRVILIAMSCLISQCSDPPCPNIEFFPQNDFIYKNNSGVDLTIRAFRNYNDTIGYWEIPNEGEIVVTTFDYARLPLGLTLKDNESITVVVRFNNNECLTYDNETEGNDILFSENEKYDWKTEGGIRREKNEIERLVGKFPKHCEYYYSIDRATWIFTSEDLNDARPCEEMETNLRV